MSDANKDRVYIPKKAIPQKMSYSPTQLYDMLCQLSPEQLNWIVFYLRIPKLMIPASYDTVGEKAQVIVSFAENSPGVGMEKLSIAVQKAMTNAPAKAKSGAGVWILSLLLLGGAAYYFVIRPSPIIEAKKIEAPPLADAKPLLALNTPNPPKEPSPITPEKEPASSNTQPTAVPAVETPKEPPPSEPPPSEPPPSEPPPKEPEPTISIAPGTVLLFDSSSTEIAATHHDTLDTIVGLMSKASEARLRIEGHADPEGDSARNLRISQGRAREAKKYLTGKGIAAKRIEIVGCGDRVPLGDSSTPNGLTKSRRVEFTLLEKGSPKACTPLPSE